MRVLFFVLGLMCCSAQAQELWRSAVYGMTPAQLQSALPEAAQASKPAPLSNGATNLLSLRNVQIVGRPFEANFYFLEDRLVQVTLLAEISGVVNDSLFVFEDIARALRDKYGLELNKQIKRDTLGASASADWITTEITISTYASIFPSSGNIYITYKSRKASSGNL